MAIPAVIHWRRGDDLSYVTAQTFPLPPGAWTATAAFRDARNALDDAQDFGIVVTLEDMGPSTDPSADPGDHDWHLSMRATKLVILGWPRQRVGNEPVNMPGVITFTDGVNCASTDDFVLRSRP